MKKFRSMNVLFLTLIDIKTIEERGIYPDLLRKFRDEGHNITIVSAVERRKKIKTSLIEKDNVRILNVKTLNIQKTNFVEKGIGTLMIEYQFLSAIKKYLSKDKFDLVLYATPPITFEKVIKYVKNRDNAKTYLLLKDIFPQNAVDLGMIKEGGILHKFFTKKEKKLYAISDTIGCMSKANVDFLLKHNPEINSTKVEVNPNTIEPLFFSITEEERIKIRKKYQIPQDRKVLVYGGNLGKPQGIDFVLETISKTTNNKAYFLIVGNGTEYGKVKKWFDENQPPNTRLLQYLPKSDYDMLLRACDIGLIFLDKRFLIPNFPSRLLSYLEMKLPVISATDKNTDVGDVIEEAKCGYKVLAGNQKDMQNKINKILNEDDLKELSDNSYSLLLDKYTVDKSYKLILNRM